jgi:hypothetical protein
MEDAQALVHSVLQIMYPRTPYERYIQRNVQLWLRFAKDSPPPWNNFLDMSIRPSRMKGLTMNPCGLLMRQLAPQYEGTVALE